MLGEGYCLAAAGSDISQSPLLLLWPWIVIFGIFYMLVFRPQRLKQKELEKMISEVQKGDNIVTSGGLLGIVAGVKEKTISLKIADNVKVEILRTSVTHVEKAKTNNQ